MKLSIIIPALNEAAALPRTLARLQGIRDRGHELIVVDGGSTDATKDLAREQADQVIDGPAGRARQMNAGAAVAQGDVLLFLHADSLLPRHADQLIEQALQRALWGRFDVRIEGLSWQLPMVAWFINRRSRLTGVATGDQGIFLRKAVFELLGGFIDAPLMEDLALTTQLRALCRPANIAEPIQTSGRRWDQAGAWKTILLMWRLRWAYWRGAQPDLLAQLYRLPSQPRPKTHIVIFAKAPEAGFAKTRLIPALGPEGAARVARQLLEHAVAEACAAGLGPVTLCVTPDLNHPLLRSLAARYPVTITLQSEGHLGKRMHNAFRSAFTDDPEMPVMIMGTDAPGLTAARLQAAARRLQAVPPSSVVYVPALDGGYALVGLKKPQPALFEDIPWSTDQVLRASQTKAKATGITAVCLPALSDIDEPKDLVHLPADWQPLLAAQPA